MANPRIQTPDLNLAATGPQPWYFRRVTIALGIAALFVAMLVALKNSKAAPGAQPKLSASPLALPRPSLPPDSRATHGSPVEKTQTVLGTTPPIVTASAATFGRIAQMDEESLIRAARATEIRKLIEVDPGLLLRIKEEMHSDVSTPKALLLKAEAEFQLSQYRRAAGTYTKLIHQHPGITKYKYLRAMAYASGNRRDLALSDLEEAISREPTLAGEARKETRFAQLSRNSKFRALTRLHPGPRLLGSRGSATK